MRKFKKTLIMFLLVVITLLMVHHRSWIAENGRYAITYSLELRLWVLLLIASAVFAAGFIFCSLFVAQNDKYYSGMVDGIELGRVMRKKARESKNLFTVKDYEERMIANDRI